MQILLFVFVFGFLGLLGFLLHRAGLIPMLGQSIGIALEMLRMHKLRAFLTMLGVIIGVMSVTIIVMISNGFQYFLTSEFQRLGSDTIFIFFDPGRGQMRAGIEGLKNEDVKYILDQVPEIEMAAPIMQLPKQDVIHGERKVDNPRIFASNEYFDDLNRIGLLSGRPIDENDTRDRANVAVIGEELAERLFGEASPLGETIQLSGITLEVIGVSEKIEMMGETTGRDVVVPLSTAQDKWIGGNTIMFISMRPKPGVKVDDAVQRVWEAMMRKSNNKPIYRVDSRESILQVFTAILGSAGAILAGIAALALLVGGIGIMNIMLVSVTERTREIGLRKAVGAKRSAVLTQFLVEAAVLSLVGGMIGMASAWVLGAIVTLITSSIGFPSKGGLATPFPVPAAVAAMVFSAVIGIVFGLYPAVSAAKLNPIDALRKE